MKNIKIINICLRALFVVLVVSIASIAFAENYLPQIGESFRFYPIAEKSKVACKGFDCFYDPALTIKNGEIIINPTNRFMVDANQVTPYSEIEGYTFVLKKTTKENAGKKIDKQNLLCELVREDGKEILLRIPYVPKKTDNIFTQQMALNSYHISLPVYPISQYDSIKTMYSGKYIVYHPLYFSNFSFEKMEQEKKLTAALKEMTSLINTDEFLEYNKAIYCKDITFIEYKELAFCQPVAQCIWNNKDVYIPACRFRAAGYLSYGIEFNMQEFFVDKETLIDDVLQKWTKDINKQDYINHDLRFQKSDFKNYRDKQWEHLNAVTIDSVSRYPLVENEVYHCYGVDLCSYNDGYSSPVSFLFQDKNGGKFEIGLVTIIANNSKRYRPIFIREDEYKAKIQREEEEAESRRREEKQKKTERLRRLTQLYGATNAKTILEGKVRIGFTKSMCREAWGNPDDINRTTTSWGTHEQWVYGHESYLYFDGDKLTTIQN